MQQHIRHLPLADSAWLARTFARNRAMYGGWTMTQGTPEGGTAGSGGGAGGSGDGNSGGDGSGSGGQQNSGGTGSQSPATGDQGGNSGGSGQSDKGFPADTPVAEMTLEQQIAYHKHQSRRHEQRATAYYQAVGGKSADEIKQEMEAARVAKLTADEKAVEEAKRAAREETTREYGPKSVRAAFNLLLGDMPEQDRDDEIGLLDLSKFLTADGEVDTDKVRNHASKIAPAGKDNGQRDYGQGRRNGQQKSGVSAGADMFAASRNKSTNS